MSPEKRVSEHRKERRESVLDLVFVVALSACLYLVLVDHAAVFRGAVWLLANR